MDSSKCSGLFILTEKWNIGQLISLMHQSLIENRSRILGGISRSTTAVLSNVAALKNARGVKKMFNGDIFSFRYSLLFALNLIG